MFKELDTVWKGKWQYNGFSKKKEFVVMVVLAYNADRPEQLDIVGTRDKGLIGNVFGYSMTVNHDKFHSCYKCKKLKQHRIVHWQKN